jgi:hypothetical protein
VKVAEAAKVGREQLRAAFPNAGNETLPVGRIGYFSERIYYLPEADQRTSIEMVVCKFGGASGKRYFSVERREAANEVLEARSEFKD